MQRVSRGRRKASAHGRCVTRGCRRPRQRVVTLQIRGRTKGQRFSSTKGERERGRSDRPFFPPPCVTSRKRHTHTHTHTHRSTTCLARCFSLLSGLSLQSTTIGVDYVENFRLYYVKKLAYRNFRTEGRGNFGKKRDRYFSNRRPFSIFESKNCRELLSRVFLANGHCF